jgi:inorganic pyrophosphatase
LEKNKSTEITGWGDEAKAAEMILAGIERAKGAADPT